MGAKSVQVFAEPQSPGVGATFQRGSITLNDNLLTSPFLDVLMGS
jgi:hypothetical protein